MSGLSEEEINKMVNELVHDKESVSTEEKSESTTSTEQKQESNTADKELKKLMSGLFSELITTFIPPEVKNNKNFKMNKMMNMLLSSFEQSKNKETDTTDKNKSEENQPLEENASQSDTDQSVDEDQPEEDTQSEEDSSQSDDDEEEETSQSDNDEEENTQSDDEDVTEPSIYVVLQNGTAIGYTSSFSTAEKISIQLYKQFIFKNTTRYLRTEKSLGQITVYERNPHLLLPFLENIVFDLSIVSLYEL
jgi:hypothetical protein